MSFEADVIGEIVIQTIAFLTNFTAVLATIW